LNLQSENLVSKFAALKFQQLVYRYNWVKEFGIDGWRLDYPIEIPPAFWKEFRDRCRAEDPSCVTVGELFGVVPQAVGEAAGLSHSRASCCLHGGPYCCHRLNRVLTAKERGEKCCQPYEEGHFDSLMNYAFGTCALGFTGGDVELRQDDAIGGEYQVLALDGPGFRREYAAVCGAYQSAHRASGSGLGGGSAHPSMLMNLFDSHDTARALWMLRGDAAALRLLLLMQACAPGPPMIYQGTEVGQVGQLGLEVGLYKLNPGDPI
jgi:cyclomaltodextrinase